jgi:transcription initiation factor TFIIIB Brf1 subunit/transcription initiation factor TFIIB
MYAPSPFTYKKQKWEETSSCKEKNLKQIMSNINSETNSQGLQAYSTDF